jgi:hypothetical protein
MVSYPYEGDKGKFFGIFWAIFNFGAVIGALVCLNSFSTHICGGGSDLAVPPYYLPSVATGSARRIAKAQSHVRLLLVT